MKRTLFIAGLIAVLALAFVLIVASATHDRRAAATNMKKLHVPPAHRILFPSQPQMTLTADLPLSNQVHQPKP